MTVHLLIALLDSPKCIWDVLLRCSCAHDRRDEERISGSSKGDVRCCILHRLKLSFSLQKFKAIIMSVYIGALTGFVFLVSICFCIGDLETVATSATGVPLIQIFFDSTRSKVGTCFLASQIAVIGIFCAAALQAEGSRSLYAFARDHGLPFSPFWGKVNKKRKVPLNALFLTAGVQMALCAIDFGTVTGFNTVIAIATEGFCKQEYSVIYFLLILNECFLDLSYAMPLGVRIIGKITGHHKNLEGPYKLGKYSILVNAIGLIFLLFASITFNFPMGK